MKSPIASWTCTIGNILVVDEREREKINSHEEGTSAIAEHNVYLTNGMFHMVTCL